MKNKQTEELNINLDKLEEIEVERISDGDIKQLEEFSMKPNKIQSVDVVRVNSPYARASDGKIHCLKVMGEIVHKIEKDNLTIEFRPSELIALEEDQEGKLLGLSKYEKSPWQKFKKVLNIEKPKDAIGKELPIKVDKREKSVFLRYMYK